MVAPMNDLKRCYEILEIGPESTYEEARTAFRDMVSIWHPDKFTHNLRLKQKAEEKIKLINAAWEELQPFFLQNNNNTTEISGKELVVSAATCSPREFKQRYKERKTHKVGCYITDIDFEPLVDVGRVRKAYRHRYHSCGPDPGCIDRENCDPKADSAESEFFRRESVGIEECLTAGEWTNGPHSHESGVTDSSRRRSGGEAYRDKTAHASGEHCSGGKGAAKGHREAQQFHNDPLNESGRKVKLLTDSYWLGFLERKFVNWQQREREHRKQRDADKEISRKNKILTDRYLSGFKTWLAKEKAKHRSSSIIGGLFKRSASLGVGGSSEKFLFGVPDISLTFVKGGAFLAGNDPSSKLAQPRGGSSGHHYHVVMLNDYYIGRYPVTVRQWSKTMGVEPNGNELDLPVLLTWESMHKFISRLNEITGLKFRVPTVEEWQYFARCSGYDENRYRAANAGVMRDHFSQVARRFRQHKSSAKGYIDMSGNGGEWVIVTIPEKTLRKAPQGTRWGSGNSGHSSRGAVQRDLRGNIQVLHTLPKSFKATEMGIRFCFRLAHPTL